MLKKIFYKLFSKKDKLNVGRTNEYLRRLWLEKTLKQIPKDSKILDAGAGEQQFKDLCKHLNYTSQDFAQYNPEELDSGLQKRQWDYGELDIISDIASIPREDSSFDVIMCTEVLEHIVNPREAIKEFSRLLRPEGYLIITAPFCSLTHFAPYHFYSGFNRFFYETELPKHDFTNIEIIANGNYFEYLAQEVHRLPNVAKQYSSTEFKPSELKTLQKLKGTLQNLSRKDKGSSELLCFGYHILARKK